MIDLKRLFTLVLCCCLRVGAAAANAAAVDDVALVDQASSPLLVLPASKVPPDVSGAADLLEQYILRSINVAPKRVSEQAARDPKVPVIYLGRGEFVDERIGAQLDRLKSDHSFIIQADGNTVIVAGKTPFGTWCGATEFLRRYCGVRWYMPGPLWEVVKPQPSLVVPAGTVEVNPAFISRHHSGHRHPLEHRWLRLQGSAHVYDFHHAAGRWSGAEPLKAFKDRPELFSLINGRRQIPGPGSLAGWQVCMTNPEVIDEYAKMADAYFTNAPQMKSFSVSPNDGASYCECDDCRKLYGAEEGEGSFDNRSALVFHLVNEVARRIATKWPDRMVGILAYSQYRMPSPGLKVEPNVVVYQVGCRSTYGDPAQREQYQQSYEAWKQAGVKHFGIYEWHHGSFFTVPVMYPHLLAEAMKDGVANGADGWYSEDYPAWGLQGPSHWIVARLLWDVNQDVDAMIDEYCADLFGPAAKTMRAYFDRCEQQWREHGGGGGAGSPAQFDAYPMEVFVELRKLLDQAEKETVNAEPQGTRVRFFSAALGLGERMAPRHYAADDAVKRIESGDIKGAMEAIAEASDPQQDPMLYMKLAMDPVPLMYYYRTDTVDRHFTASESLLLRAKVSLVDRVVAALKPSMLSAGTSVTTRDFDAAVTEAMSATLPVVEHRNGSLLMADLKGFAGKMTSIPLVEEPPAIDGELEDSAWATASPQSGFYGHGSGRPARHKTIFRTVWHGDRLYVRAQCYQNMTKPKAAAGSRDGNAWLDDAIELHVNLPNAAEKTDMVVVIVNVAGQIFDMKRGDAKWDGDVKTATKLKDDHWTLEFSVPLADLGIESAGDNVVRMNVVRDAWGAYTGGEISSWFPTVFATMDLNIRGWGILEGKQN